MIAVAMVIFIPYYGFYKSDQSKSVSAHAREKQTILLQNVTGLLTDKVTILTLSDLPYSTTPYLVSTSELDRITHRTQTVVIANSTDSHSPVIEMEGDLGPQYTPLYFLPGDSLEYNICISTTRNDDSVFALVIAFNREDYYNDFTISPWPDYGSTTAYWHHRVNVTNTTVCQSVNFTARNHDYYYFSGVINSTSTNKTGQVAYAYHVTNIHRTFNLSDPAVSMICPDAESPETCSHDLSFGTTMYSILATIVPLSTDIRDSGSLTYDVTVGFRWSAICVLVAAALVTVVPITVCLSCIVVELLLYLCNRKN